MMLFLCRPVPTLPQQDVTDCCVYIVVDGVSAVDHQAIHKLHGLGPLTPQLARHHNLAALGSTLHDEPQNTIASPEGKQVQVFTFIQICLCQVYNVQFWTVFRCKMTQHGEFSGCISETVVLYHTVRDSKMLVITSLLHTAVALVF